MFFALLRKAIRENIPGAACAENLIRPGEQLSGFGGGRMSWLLSEGPPAAA
jgi:hypothetical protein